MVPKQIKTLQICSPMLQFFLVSDIIYPRMITIICTMYVLVKISAYYTDK